MSLSGFRWSDLRRRSWRASIRPQLSSRSPERVDPAEAHGDRRVLSHVRVDEQFPARRQHARRFGEHVPQCLRRQVLEDVQRERLGEGAVVERQLPQIADQEVDARAGHPGEERADVDADRPRSPVTVPQQRASAAAAEIDDEVVRLGRQERAQHVVADPRAQERRRHRLVPRVGVQRFVEVLCLFRVLDAWSKIQVVRRRAVVRAPASATHERVGVPASTPWQSGHRTSESSEAEIISCERSSRRTAPPAVRPVVPRSMRAPRRAARASCRRERRIGEQSFDRMRQSAPTSPGGTSNAFDVVGAGLRGSTANRSRRLAVPRPCIRTVSTAT